MAIAAPTQSITTNRVRSVCLPQAVPRELHSSNKTKHSHKDGKDQRKKAKVVTLCLGGAFAFGVADDDITPPGGRHFSFDLNSEVFDCNDISVSAERDDASPHGRFDPAHSAVEFPRARTVRLLGTSHTPAAGSQVRPTWAIS